MITFASCFAIGKANRKGTFPKCRAGLGHHPSSQAPYFCNFCNPPPPLRALPYTYNIDIHIPQDFVLEVSFGILVHLVLASSLNFSLF